MLISQAALNHGITKVIFDILSCKDSNHLYKIPFLNLGYTFIDVFVYGKLIKVL